MAPYQPDPPPGPICFLSYARIPKHNPSDRVDPNYWVRTFYESLTIDLANLSANPAGFMDVTLELGSSWVAAITAHLNTCSVFVPLYSPRLFQSKNCGREWATFAHRFDGVPAIDRPIVPVLWAPCRDLPPCAREIQYRGPDLGEKYHREGLYGLMRTHRAEANRVIMKLATVIVAKAHESRHLPHGTAEDFTLSENAFGGQDGERPLALAVLSAPDWHARDVAVRIASAKQCTPDLRDLHSFRAELTRSHPVRPVVVIVDAKAAGPDLRYLVVKPWVAVVVVWEKDPSPDDLRRIGETLGPKAKERGMVTQVAAAADLEEALIEQVDNASRQYFKHGAANPPPDSGTERPRF
ncbi:TIR-like protein FxsC [Nonomuraea sp. NPDC050663]|uniref:TIR-like protein FxsC n=1 Tax=Nonomuraea sp. NPDC050663 TaxID=3364370 RepID=UPI0037A52AF2